MIFALLLATMSFLAPNVADACSATLKCPRSVADAVGQTIGCSGNRKCSAGNGQVFCSNADGTVSSASC